MPAPRCFPGRVIKNRYQLDEVIGKGRVSTVYRAHDLRSDRACAIKLLGTSAAQDRTQRDRLAREGALGSRLCHHNLPMIYALDEDGDGTPFLVMELMSGPTLQTVLRQQGRLSWEQASHLLDSLIRGLSCAHALGVLHRDLRPQNIVLVPGEQEANTRSVDIRRATVKIIDFGLAGEAEATRAASISAPLCPDMEYRAPELLSPAMRVDARADQWSLAVVAYEVLAGVRPFSETDPVRLALQIRAGRFTPLSLHRPELPPHISAAIERALSVQPQERFASVAELGQALHGKWPRRSADSAAPPLAESEPAAGPELFAAVLERIRPGRDRWLLHTMALSTLALLAFALPFSWVGGVRSQRGGVPTASALLDQKLALRSQATTLTAQVPPRREAARLPPLRVADRDPTVLYPPLRLQGED